MTPLLTPSQLGTPVVVHLFGPFECRIWGEALRPLRTRKGQWVLALLLLRGGAEVSRNWLAGVLWPESPDSQSLSSLRRCLTDLRQALGDASTLLRSPSQHSLALALREIGADVLEFDAAISRGDRASLERAVALYRGPLLEGCTEEWVWQERQRREQSYLAALEQLAALAMEARDPAAAVRFLRRAVAVDPFRESAHRELIAALAAAGDFAAATVVYRDLRSRLYAELSTQPSPETTALFERIRREARLRAEVSGEAPAECRSGSWKVTREAAPVLASPAPPPVAGSGSEGSGSDVATVLPPSHLPRPLTELLGREQEVREIKDRLGSSRLVTLAGTGGLGKTRLGIRVAEEVLLDYPDGAWFVDLSSLTDGANVPHAVATVLGVHEENHRPIQETLVEHAREKRLLLVLDNCEHLVEACARLAHQLLVECREIRILATSRETLGIEGETVWRVPALSLPPEADPEASAEQLAGSAAVRLFAERASAARPGFVVNARNLALVAQLCRRLDGIPLALELAAARLKVLSIEQIVTRLDDRFRLLTGGSRTALPRQQTLRAALDWSYELLTGPERRMLHRLSVFAGAWTLDAAERVCADVPRCESTPATAGQAPRLAPHDVLELLTQLVEKSLVWVEEYEGELRYRLFETTREYARERLRDSGEEPHLRGRHARHFLEVVAAVQPQYESPQMGVAIARLESVREDLRSALDWLGRDEAPAEEREDALRLAADLWRFWFVRAYFTEARARLTVLLDRTSAVSRARATAFGALAVFAIEKHEPEAVLRCAEASATLFARLDDAPGMIWAVNLLGRVAEAGGDLVGARARYEEVLERSEQAGYEAGVAMARNNLAQLALEEGDGPGARRHLEGCMEVNRRRGNSGGIAWTYAHLGRLAFQEADPEAAREHFSRSLEIFRELNHPRGITICLGGLAEAERQSGSGAQSAARAACLFSAVLAHERSLGFRPPRTGGAGEDPIHGQLRAALGEVSFAQQWDRGRKMTLDEAIQFALVELRPRSGARYAM